MEMDSINANLAKAIGIEGVGVSYQSFHQPGITPAMWKEAGQMAARKSNDKRSRAFIREKYAWAPEGLCVYVSKQNEVTKARKVLIERYGECDEDGNLPTWPGGSRMRFIPLKNTWIKNEKTRNKVEKRVKFHVYTKGNEHEEPTVFKNIGDTIESFEGKTFQETIMDIDSIKKPGVKLFRHFKHMWTPDPKKVKWSLSIHSAMKVEAMQRLQDINSEMQDKYGDEVKKFFQEEQRNSYYGSTGRTPKFNLDEEANPVGVFFKVLSFNI